MKVSMVSVSRTAGPPQRGQVVWTHSVAPGRGVPPPSRTFTSMGSSTGSWSSGTGTMPHFSQVTTGMGAPQ